MLNIAHYQRKAHQNYNEISPHMSEWQSSKSLQTINAGQGMEKRECCCTVGGNVNYSHYGNNNLRYADDTTFMAESEEELKSLLMKEESEKVGLKLNIQKIKIMASGPITSWEIDGETVETVSEFILGGSQITEDGD